MSKTKVAIIGSGQHRHRPDDQGDATVRGSRDGRDGRHRPRRPTGWPAPKRMGVPITADGVDGLIALPDFDDIADRLRRDVGEGPPRQRRQARAARQALIDLTPAAIGPYTVPAVNLERAPGRAERQHGDVRRAGDDPDRRRGESGDAGALRRDRRVDLVASRPGRGRGRTSTSSPRPRSGDRAGRRRRARQGDHRPQPGRPAADHARHRLCLVDGSTTAARAVTASIEAMVAEVAAYVPGYRLKQKVQFRDRRRREIRIFDRGTRAGRPDAGQGVPRGRGRRALPARLRRQPRHHDLGRVARRRELAPAPRHRNAAAEAVA